METCTELTDDHSEVGFAVRCLNVLLKTDQAGLWVGGCHPVVFSCENTNTMPSPQSLPWAFSRSQTSTHCLVHLQLSKQQLLSYLYLHLSNQQVVFSLPSLTVKPESYLILISSKLSSHPHLWLSDQKVISSPSPASCHFIPISTC